MVETTTTPSYDAVVCIPTFRRPDHLRKTLDSLVAQVGGVRFAVVVVDNDAAHPVGKPAADEFFASGALAGFSVVEPRQGNCFAINRAFATALDTYRHVSYFLMIDDDEIAAPSWLAEMVSAARASGADLVGGPVLRNFLGAQKRWAIRHPLFNTPAYASGFVPTLYGSGNCLISRHVFEALDDPGFDLRFNFLGGGDMDFFTRCRRLGCKTYWNSQAIAIETAPAQRATMGYVLRRGVATGVINYAIDRKHRPGAAGFALLAAKNAVSLALSLGRAAGLLWSTRHWLPASFPICMAIGRALGSFGFAPAPYKA